jgi:hypothetical protein
MSNIERRLKNFEVRIRINNEILIGKNLACLPQTGYIVLGTSYNYLLLDTSESRYCVQFQASCYLILAT